MWGYLAAYFVVLLSFTAIWFRHSGLLYLGRDADLSLWLGKAYLDWAHPLDVTAMNPLQGMTSMLMAINPYFNPAVWIFQTDIPETSKQVVSFTIYFTEVTLSALARHQSALRPYADAQQPAACRAHQHRRRAACQEELRIPACFQLAARQLHLPSDPAERPCRAVLQRRDAAWIAAARGRHFFLVDLLPAAALAVGRRHPRAGLLRCFALSRVFRRREGLFRAFLRPGDFSAGISLVDGVRS